MALHPLLEHQIARHLAGVDPNAEPWAAFLEAVHQAYADFDRHRHTVERAMAASSTELVEANGQLDAIVEAFPDQILHVDDQGFVVSSRGKACDAFRGIARLEGRHLADLLPPSAVPAFEEAVRMTVQTHQVATFRFLTEGVSGVTAYETRLAPLVSAGAIVLVRDVTQQQRVDEMRVAKEAAEAATRARSRFLANVSHELRTPLNAVIGYSEMLSEDAASSGSPHLIEDLGRITAAGRHVLQIVNDLLDISKIDAGRMTCDLALVPLAPLIEEALAESLPLATANGNDLRSVHAPGLAAMRTDPAKLRQILVNLLSNACKFTTRGVVTLEVRPSDVDARQGVAFVVTDTGIGIAPDRIGQLFQDFVQLDDSATRRHDGTGLGLSITRRLCKMLGGHIAVESQAGVGSVFSVWLPVGGPVYPTASTTSDEALRV
ncbi:MAG: ATP-binding protein [Acidobacteriota bacterium]